MRETARAAVEFLNEALACVPVSWTIQGVRADAAFYDQKLLAFLEDRQLGYVIVAKRRDGVQEHVRRIESWRAIDERTAVGGFTVQMPAWSRPRRFIAVRLRLADPNEPCLLAVPGYEFRVFVTNRIKPAEWLWKHYDRRAAIEPRFSELKSGAIAGRCGHKFVLFMSRAWGGLAQRKG